jgi:hypothetical protein
MSGITFRALPGAALFILAAPVVAQQLTAVQGASRVEALQRQQCLVQQDVFGLRSASTEGRVQAIAMLRETKTRMHAELSALEAEIGGTPTLQSAAELLRELRLAEKIQYSQGTIEQWTDSSERRLERIIQEDLAAVRAAFLPTAPPVTCGGAPA